MTEIALIAVISVLIIKTFLVQPFLVSGDSMEPNFSDGNYLLVDELTYRFREPERGEVIVFRYPENDSIFYIKRIVGLPGETIKIKHGEVTVLDGDNQEEEIIKELYLPGSAKTSGEVEIKIKEGQYFVMGDNRSASSDSRSWGAVSRKLMVGKAFLRLLPINKIGILPGSYKDN